MSAVACEASPITAVEAEASAPEAPSLPTAPPAPPARRPPSNMARSYVEPETSLEAVEVDDVPAPSREPRPNAFLWDPRPTVKRRAGESRRDLAARIIGGRMGRRLLGTRPGIDVYRSDSTSPTAQIEFQHFVRWRGQLVRTFRAVFVALADNVLWGIEAPDRTTKIELPNRPPMGEPAALAALERKADAKLFPKLGLEVVMLGPQPKLVYTFGGVPNSLYRVDAFTGDVFEQRTDFVH